jgi:subtilisin family serine protease
LKKILLYICALLFLINISVQVNSGNFVINQDSISPLVSDYKSGEFIVKFRDSPLDYPFIYEMVEKYDIVSMEKVFGNSENNLLNHIYILKTKEDVDIFPVIQDYSSCANVIYAEPNSYADLFVLPNDPSFSSQWALHNYGQTDGKVDADIDAPEAWDIETGNPDIVIAVIDTGIDYTHPDLADNIWVNEDEICSNNIDDDDNGYVDDINGWDFFNQDNDPIDDVGHGTACAGIAGAVGDNNIGIAGVCWSCSLMPVKVGNFTHVTRVTIARGVEYAVDNGASVISMSFGFSDYSFLDKDIFEYAYEKGVVLVASAGNRGDNRKCYPAAYENVIAVAATDHKDYRMHVYVEPPDMPGQWMSSNYGLWVDVAAPGVNIHTTMPTYHVVFNDFGHDVNYSNFTAGTSLSCPYVAGLAALILSKNSSYDPDFVRSVICTNVDPYNSLKYIGTGRINAYYSLKKVKSLSGATENNDLKIPIINIDLKFHIKFGNYKIRNFY